VFPEGSDSSVARESGGELRDHFAKNRILEGAALVFTRKGVRAATVEDILRASGVSRRTFYRFFSSKDDTLDALHGMTTALLFEKQNAAFAIPEPPLQKLVRMVDAALTFARQNAGLIRVLHGETLRPGSPLAARRLEMLAELSSRITWRIRETLGITIDSFLIEGLLIAQEGIIHKMIATDPVDDATYGRARAAILRIMAATLSGQGAHLPPLPQADEPLS
jgi:AcrR family transcriptional regulator